MTSLRVGDAVRVWMGPSVGAEGKVERKYAGGDGWTWVVLKTLDGEEVRTHVATVEPLVTFSAEGRSYTETFYPTY